MSQPAARDAALATLMLPFESGLLAWPDDPRRVSFLRARAGAGLPDAARQWACEQGFRPHADGLLAHGMQVVPPVRDANFSCVLVLPPRQREESRGLLANAVAACEAGGVIVAAQRNDEGARSLQDDLGRLCGGGVQAASKHHCRVAWVHLDPSRVDQALQGAWRDADAPRLVEATGLLSRPGVFSWDRTDRGSALLVDALPQDLAGRFADFGAGIGVLSLALLRGGRGIVSLDVYEAQMRALELARANIDGSDPDIPVGYHWHDVAGGVAARFDGIVCNPPFHVGRDPDPELGIAFIRAAADALVPGGRLWLVANRRLPYEAALGAAFASVRSVREADGFKVVEAVRA